MEPTCVEEAIINKQLKGRDMAQTSSESTETTGYVKNNMNNLSEIDVEFESFIEFPDENNNRYVTATSAKMFAEHWAGVRSVDSKIDIVLEFVREYERQKYETMRNGGKLQSVNCFMLDYCQRLRLNT